MALRYAALQKGIQELESKFEEFHQDHHYFTTGEDPEGKEAVDDDAASGLDDNRLRSTEDDVSRKFDFLKKLLLAEMESHRTHDDSEAKLLHVIGVKLEALEDEFFKCKIPVMESPAHDDLGHHLRCNCSVSCFQKVEVEEEEDRNDDDDDHGDVVDKEGMIEESPAVEAVDCDVLPLMGEEKEIKKGEKKMKKNKKWTLGYRMLMAFLLVIVAASIGIAVIGWIEEDEDDEFLVPT